MPYNRPMRKRGKIVYRSFEDMEDNVGELTEDIDDRRLLDHHE